MIIEMERGNVEEFKNFKGGEGSLDAVMFFDGVNRILRGTLKPGSSIGYHKHEGNSEIIFVLSGRGKVLMDDGVEYVEAGQCHYCPQDHSHSLINEGPEDLVVCAVVPQRG